MEHPNRPSSTARGPSIAWITIAAVVLVLAGCPAIETVVEPEPEPPRRPHSELEPEEVVRITVEALAAGTAGDLDAELLYAFASPDKRAAFDDRYDYAEHFTRGPYRPLVGHAEAQYHPLDLDNRIARQDVTVTTEAGQARRFGFLLVKAEADDCNDCWLVEAVRAYLD